MSPAGRTEEAGTCTHIAAPAAAGVVEGRQRLSYFFVLDQWRMGKLGAHPGELAGSETALRFCQEGPGRPVPAGCQWLPLCNGCRRDAGSAWTATRTALLCARFRLYLPSVDGEQTPHGIGWRPGVR